jgi:alpha-amylase
MYYIIKWLTDFIRKYGIDGYRLDTAKHVEEGLWGELGREARLAFQQWKEEHPDKVLDGNDFYMVAEVYGYQISSGRNFWFGDREVDFYAQEIHSMINFEFKQSAAQEYEALFSSYSEKLHQTLNGKGVLNYLTSHDDGDPFDRNREKPLVAATKLLLSPGTSQVYYGDESCRALMIPGAAGDANLRGMMNWEEIESNATRNGYSVVDVLEHYKKLGQFRRDHPAVGAGRHQMLGSSPYTFSRSFQKADYHDLVVAGIDLEPGEVILELSNLFEEGTRLVDYYSGEAAVVRKGKVAIDTPYDIVLLGIK